MSSTLSGIDGEKRLRHRGDRIHSSLYKDGFNTWNVVQKTVKGQLERDCKIRD